MLRNLGYNNCYRLYNLEHYHNVLVDGIKQRCKWGISYTIPLSQKLQETYKVHKFAGNMNKRFFYLRYSRLPALIPIIFIVT